MTLTEQKVTDSGRIDLYVKIEPDEVESYVESEYKKNRSRISAPGFRKGKVPRSIYEKMYGKGVLIDEALNNRLQDFYKLAIDESEIDTIDQASCRIDDYSEENGVVVVFSVLPRPQITIDDYKSMELTSRLREVTEQDIDRELGVMREKVARIINVEDRACRKDDIVKIDFEGFIDNVPFEGGKAEGHTLTIGSNQFIPGFEDQIIGHSIGESFEINVTFPENYGKTDEETEADPEVDGDKHEDYHDHEHLSLGGKDAVFKIKLNEIQVKELPEYDDDFAADVSEFDTLDELKDSLRRKLETEFKANNESMIENQLQDLLAQKVTDEIPEVMVENMLDRIISQINRNMMQSGVNLEWYLNITGMTIEEYRNMQREKAVDGVKAELALEYVARSEGLTVSEEEIEKEYEEMAKIFNEDISVVKKEVDDKYIIKDLLGRKAMETVKNYAVITTKSEEDPE